MERDLQKGLGYLVDQSHPPLFFAAVVGVGEVLEHGLGGLDVPGRDVSPIVVESQNQIVIINIYDPEPLSVQIVQHHGPLERRTEILGAGIGLGVLAEVRRAAKVLDLELGAMNEHFLKRIGTEKTTYRQTYALFRGTPQEKAARFAQVLRGLQDKHRREANLLRDLL